MSTDQHDDVDGARVAGDLDGAGLDGAGLDGAGLDGAGVGAASTSDADRDEVDRIVAAWRRERPDLDVRPLEVLSRVTRLARHLDRHRSAAFAAHGLEPWEFDVLAALRRAGAPYQLSPGQLTAETLVTSGTMTNRIDRLEARALVRRRPDPADGRGVLVRLTDDGRELVDTALEDLLGRERILLAGLGPQDTAALAAQLRRLVAPFDGPPEP